MFISGWISASIETSRVLRWDLISVTVEDFEDNMNSYFEQSGFYGSHHHQGGAGEQAAYRSFPLGLGMGAYGAQHALQRPQESPYDASVAAAACKLYAGEQPPAYKPDCSKDSGQNGYSDKTWGSARPAACTPDARAYGPPLEPASPGGGAPRPAAALASWNTQCSLGGGAQPVPTQLHQQTANHTFYPWMAIAGQTPKFLKNKI